MLYLSSYQLLGDELHVPDRKEQFCTILSNTPHQCKPVKELYAEMVGGDYILYTCTQ